MVRVYEDICHCSLYRVLSKEEDEVARNNYCEICNDCDRFIGEFKTFKDMQLKLKDDWYSDEMMLECKGWFDD